MKKFQMIRMLVHFFMIRRLQNCFNFFQNIEQPWKELKIYRFHVVSLKCMTAPMKGV